MGGFRLWPASASDVAVRVDQLVVLLLILSGAILALVLGLVLGFAIRYRRGSRAKRGLLPKLLRSEVEIGWTSATALLAVFLFFWAASSELGLGRPTGHPIEIHVVAKQWMWKTQHPNGAREINALHVPLGEQVRLLMTSQDVIHSFYVPEFRIKQDVVPGRLTELLFRPTELGTFHLFCSEYCGTLHARMGGSVTVMPPAEYAKWAAAQPEGDDLGREGAALFVSLGCAGCHVGSTVVHAPNLAGLYGTDVHLSDGRVVLADEAYIRDSILQPNRDVVAGYQPVMPSFAGIVGEDELQRLVAYIRSLRAEKPS
jgi:cytochrome c oxidase subunit 2